MRLCCDPEPQEIATQPTASHPHLRLLAPYLNPDFISFSLPIYCTDVMKWYIW